MENKIRLILAEDQELIRKSLIALLNEFPQIEVVGEAANGKILLALLKQVEADVVLLDFEMPLMNGFEALDIINKRFPVVKVIMLSIYNDLGLVYDAMLRGARAYLFKGCATDSLINTIMNVKKHGYYFDDNISNALLTGSKRSASINPIAGEKALSERELEVLQKICAGFTNKQIASTLHITPRTVDFHRGNIYSKTKSANIAALILYSVRNGLVNPESL